MLLVLLDASPLIGLRLMPLFVTLTETMPPLVTITHVDLGEPHVLKDKAMLVDPCAYPRSSP